jgi:hypothetical protein
MAMIHLSVFIKPVKTILTSSASQQHAIARLRHLSTQYLFLYDDISHTLALALRVQRRLCYTWCILYLGPDKKSRHERRCSQHYGAWLPAPSAGYDERVTRLYGMSAKQLQSQ